MSDLLEQAMEKAIQQAETEGEKLGGDAESQGDFITVLLQVHLYVYVYVYICTCNCTYMYMYMYIRICICMSVCICMYTCMCVCMYYEAPGAHPRM